ncbi:MAG: hypothetical protein A3A87_00315 [Candidatus Muproteobacteria bacterium RIFCSPLOWO2_01_FULL_60_18]|uniref:Uncharacterized protein n=1 Tax=Candidatus Muproteobacteria bacterium RIFCSPLOWO2_01_FULL_60_18 TaxID=1817768 RepID=A0A1F6U2S4_9PROT|nr:MAG: hypothetical protein A3A87_00315 [Candidatus Muproteobacteria bacterium RIFCSPLOWO2_01_FULL_60_18]
MQDHRVGRDQLLALESVDREHRRPGEIERRELLGDGIEPLHRATVVVLVVTDDQFLGQSLETRGIAGQRFDLV